MGECAHLDVSEDTRDENDCDEDNTQVEIVIGRVRVIHLHSVPVCLFVCFCIFLRLFLCNYYAGFGPQISTTTEYSFSFVVCDVISHIEPQIIKQKKWSYCSRVGLQIQCPQPAKVVEM
jgi:hypothetical protein